MSNPPRRAGPGVDPLFLQRWSPRALDGSAISDTDLDTLFDAARWAPSAYNAQPWRFLYARRGDENWARFLDLLVPGNQAWAERGSCLLFILSDTLLQPSPDAEPKPSSSHSFDAGAAWALLALQATRLGFQAHGMAGFDAPRARAELAVPDRFRIEAAVVVGRVADPSILPEALRAREMPSERRPVAEIAGGGSFAF
ncbi:nitroreductase family protein [Sphingomonas sp.]|uniref:nitroreductase family protein n=1 Tax=Sphingomonas sp. TaxID=28214 RepID=UPI003B008024